MSAANETTASKSATTKKATALGSAKDKRNPQSVLTPAHLRFFHSLLTLWESGKKPKVAKQFNSVEVKRFLARTDPKGHVILSIGGDPADPTPLALSELRFTKTGGAGWAKSLFNHLRNAIAHNRISYGADKNTLLLENVYRGAVRMVGKVRFSVLKELMELLLGLGQYAEQPQPTPLIKANKPNQSNNK